MGNRKTKIKDEIYWRMRSKRSGQKSVLWQNETYNKLFRKMEIKIINKLINKFHISTNAICDIGCGIGIISKYLAEKFTPICLIAVDLEEMIEVAQKKSYAKNITYYPSRAEEFYQKKHMFDIVISSGCISAILDQDKIEKTILNCARMISVNGYILLIEPIHRFHFLSRNNINESKIKNMLEKNGMQLKLRKAFLHWPTKLLISNTKINALLTKLIFYAGEFFCKLPFSYMLGDYKVMLYKKQTNHDQM